MKLSSHQWMARFNIPEKDVIDPDGWDRSNPESFNELITLDDFDSRLRRSTLHFTPEVNKFLLRNR